MACYAHILSLVVHVAMKSFAISTVMPHKLEEGNISMIPHSYEHMSIRAIAIEEIKTSQQHSLSLGGTVFKMRTLA